MDGTEEDKSEFINDRIIDSYKNYEPKLDRKVLPVLMRLYEQRVPAEYLPDIYNKIKTEFDGDYDKYADWLFANSQFTNLPDLMKLLKNVDTETLVQDPAMELALSTKDMGYEITERMMSAYENMMRGERELMAALMEMDSKELLPRCNIHATDELRFGERLQATRRGMVRLLYYRKGCAGEIS